MEFENSKNITPEALAADRCQKRRARIFGLFAVIDLILFVLFIYEIIAIVTH